MPLVDWPFLDRIYNETIDALIAKRREKVSRDGPALVERFHAWASSKSVPDEFDVLVNLLRDVYTPRLRPALRFSNETFSH